MSYTIVYSQQAQKALKKMDPSVRRLLLSWVDKNLQGCENPRLHGKGLTANLSGLWRYRVGDYRLLADIQDEKVLILLLEIGHRRDVYAP